MKTNNENEISFIELFQKLKASIFYFIIAIVIGIVISGIYTFLIVDPTYSSTTDLVINDDNAQSNQQIDSNAIQTNLSLLKTYQHIVEKPNVLSQVIEETNLNYSVEDLDSMTTVTTEEESLILSITVESESPYESAVLANSIAENFSEEVQSILQIDNVHIWNIAKENIGSVKPNVSFNLLMGAILGFLVCLIIILINHFSDSTVHSTEIIEGLGLTTLGIVSKMSPESHQDSLLKNQDSDENIKNQKRV